MVGTGVGHDVRDATGARPRSRSQSPERPLNLERLELLDDILDVVLDTDLDDTARPAPQRPLRDDIVKAIATAAGLDDHTTEHVLRHTFATTLVRGGTDLVIVAELTTLRAYESGSDHHLPDTTSACTSARRRSPRRTPPSSGTRRKRSACS